MWEPIPQPYKKGPALTSSTYEEPIQHVCPERLCTYIWHMLGTNATCTSRRALHLHLTHVRNQSNMHVRKGSALTFDTCEEPIQHACSKGLYTYIRHMKGTNPTCSSKGLALTSDQVGTNPIVISEWPPVPDWATW